MTVLFIRRPVAAKAMRLCLPFMVLAGCLYILSGKVTASHIAALPAQLDGITWQAWLAAAAFTMISLWAVGRYDGVAHAHFGTREPEHRARWSGTIAISLAQTLGFGLLTSALARWRLLADLTLPAAFLISAFVSVTFIASWAVVTAIACLVLPAPGWSLWPSLLVLALMPAALWVVFRYPSFGLARLTPRRLRMPSLRSAGALVLWAKLDTFAAAAAFFVLLPADAQSSFSAFLPIYLIALGAALISNTPGGFGVFEITVLGLMPDVPVGPLLGSLLAFRVIYYAIPALIGLTAMLFLFRPLPPVAARTVPGIRTAADAETGVIRQNGGYVLGDQTGAWAVWPTGQTLTALCNPVAGPVTPALGVLQAEARMTGRMPMVYKCNAKTAFSARNMGWAVMHISDDAMLDTAQFSLDVPARRGLRRKLRAAEKAGVTVAVARTHQFSDMARVDALWQSAHGQARGGTMGRFCPDYLSDHFIVCAWQESQLVAFASFQRSHREWCLDVMRHTADMPDGTMHALVVDAVLAAKSTGIRRVSLAATPACPDPASAFFRWAAMQAVARAGGPGLRQFKSAFAPRWAPRYAAARNGVSLCLGLADITREVHRPPPLPARPVRIIHNLDENYVLVSRRAS